VRALSDFRAHEVHPRGAADGFAAWVGNRAIIESLLRHEAILPGEFGMSGSLWSEQGNNGMVDRGLSDECKFISRLVGYLTGSRIGVLFSNFNE
jgi:hypothetical protein